jgi:hypothetical protein
MIADIAFSTSYLCQNQGVSVANDVSFRIVTLKPGISMTWPAETNKMSTCSVAAGKVRVKVQEREFYIGPNGMFKINKGLQCTVENPLYIDSILHVWTLKDFCD